MGIVTTAVDWVFIKVVSCGDNVEVFRSSGLPHSGSMELKLEHLAKPVSELFALVMGIFDKQIRTQGVQKRQ